MRMCVCKGKEKEEVRVQTVYTKQTLSDIGPSLEKLCLKDSRLI